MAEHHRVLIIGGGTAGITVAAQLRRKDPQLDIAIIEPSSKHYYQPLWTLVGAGVFPKEKSERNEADYIPPQVAWIQEAATSIDPDHNRIVTHTGRQLSYDYLIVAPGIRILWDKIPGLKEAIGTNGICSNYSYEHVDYTWECLRTFQGGTALFTMPNTAVKCGGAPQKIMYLADDIFRRNGVRDKSQIVFATASSRIFSVPKYAEALQKVIQRKGIDVRYRHNLMELRPEKHEAVFEHLDTHETVVIPYTIVHVTPPMGPPEVVQHSPLADANGWVDVDKYTLQHVRYRNVFGLGDASNLPTSKTGAAIRKQAPVVVANLLAAMNGQPLPARYNGYTSCPLVTGFGKLILAEFDYDHKPAETFPFNQAKERWSMWLLKKYFLPWMYWHGMLRGRM